MAVLFLLTLALVMAGIFIAAKLKQKRLPASLAEERQAYAAPSSESGSEGKTSALIDHFKKREWDPARACFDRSDIVRDARHMNDGAERNRLWHFAAAYDAPLDLLERLWLLDPDLETANSQGDAPIHLAAIAGSKGAARFLLAHGALPDQRGRQSTTALHRAVSFGNIAMADILIEAGSSLEARQEAA